MIVILKTIKAKHLFAIYLIAIVNFVIIKFFGDIQRVKDRINMVKTQKVEYWNLQLIPFRTITSSMDSFIRFGIDHPASFVLIANIILFVPMGYLVPFVLRKPSFLKSMGISFGIIVAIEIIQYVTNLGATDIDDVILNMIGCLIGYMVFVVSVVLYKNCTKGIEH